MCGPLLAVAWVDNKAVYFLSTIQPPEFPQRASAKAQVVRHRGAGEGGESGAVPCPPLLKDYIRLTKCCATTHALERLSSGIVVYCSMK